MQTQETVLTATGLANLKTELEELKITKRPEIVTRIEEALAYGDLSENSEYDDAKNEQAFVEGRISELEEMIATAKVVKSNDGDGGKVTLGTVVKVKHNGSVSTFTIVGSAEADPSKGLISHESPLGEALLGHKVGDQVEFETPKGMTTYTVESIGSK